LKVLVDFDGTLCPDPCSRPPVSPPSPDALAVLRRMHAAGHEIVILSCRAHAGAPDGWRARHAVREITAYLHRHDVPFDAILTNKPHCDAVIDMRATSFGGSWSRLARVFRRLAGAAD